MLDIFLQGTDACVGELLMCNHKLDGAARSWLVLPCRNNGFSQTWQQAVVAGDGRVGYLEMLRFCW